MNSSKELVELYYQSLEEMYCYVKGFGDMILLGIDSESLMKNTFS